MAHSSYLELVHDKPETVWVDFHISDDCIGYGICTRVCPAGCIYLEAQKAKNLSVWSVKRVSFSNFGLFSSMKTDQTDRFPDFCQVCRYFTPKCLTSLTWFWFFVCSVCYGRIGCKSELPLAAGLNILQADWSCKGLWENWWDRYCRYWNFPR